MDPLSSDGCGNDVATRKKGNGGNGGFVWKMCFQVESEKISGPVSVIILFSFIHDEGPGWSLLFRIDGLEMFSGAVCEIGLKFSLMNFSDR